MIKRVTWGVAVALACAGAPARGASVDPKAASTPAANAPTFAKDVAPILFENCANCHRPGEVAPFPLTSYRDAKKRAGQLADVTETRFMPPWKPEPGHGDFLGERRLTDAQVKVLRAWADAGAPEGDAAQTPKLPDFADGYPLGQPDLIVKMPEPYKLKAEGKDVFRGFVIPLNLTEDKYVTAVEFRPSNRKVVHHALFFLDSTGKARQLDAEDPGPGYAKMRGVGFVPSGGLGGWSPGVTARHLHDGIARPLKKGSDLVVQVHFSPTGKEEVEQSEIGLYFAKKQPEKLTTSFLFPAGPINIPPGERRYEVRGTLPIDPRISPNGVTLLGVTPHAHLLCREVKVDLTLPGGDKRSLIWIKDWDWNWQDQYLYKQPMKVPPGSKVDVLYVFDNSADNPHNPSSPPQRVRFGEQTTDEMAITFFQIVTDRNAPGGALAGRGRFGQGGNAGAGGAGRGSALQQMLLRRFDKNGNGTLDPDEQEEARKAVERVTGGAQ